MKTLSVCSIVALAFSLHAAQLPPTNSFRLSVVEVVNGPGCRVMNLKIETRSAEMVEMRWERGAGGSVGLVPSRNGKCLEGTVMLASMLGEGDVVCHTVTALYGRPGTHARSPVSFDIKAGTDLASVFEITITNGVYRLDRPLVVGKRNGETMRLVVGSWNWQQVSQRR